VVRADDGAERGAAHALIRGPFIATNGGAWVRGATVVRVSQTDGSFDGKTALYMGNGAVWLSDAPLGVVVRALTLIADRYK